MRRYRAGHDKAGLKMPEAKAALGRMGLRPAGTRTSSRTCGSTGFQIRVRMPKGPAKTEIWSFIFLDKKCRRTTRQALDRAKHTFGPAGLWEQDDGENWAQSTRGYGQP